MKFEADNFVANFLPAARLETKEDQRGFPADSSHASEEALIVKEIPENAFFGPKVQKSQPQFVQIGAVVNREAEGEGLMQSECESQPSNVKPTVRSPRVPKGPKVISVSRISLDIIRAEPNEIVNQ